MKTLNPQKKKTEQKHRVKKLRKQHKDLAHRLSRKLKAQASRAELVLNDALEKEGIIFWFKMPIYDQHAHYVIGFHLMSESGKKYAIEVNGPGYEKDEYEKGRSYHLYANRGHCIKRFTDEQVLTDIKAVLSAIYELNPRTKLYSWS